MSATIDERVVEMRFDNKQFEAETKTTLNTLQRLKVALTGLDSTKALDALNESVKHTKLSGIEASIQAIENRFSTMGIVGMRIIQNLTDGVMNTLGKGLAFVKERIVSGGITRAMNIENARFQLQALFANAEDGAAKVDEIMKNANKSVDGTAYAYDEAAKAASQFAASGIEAGEEMTNALRGIVGVASMTSSKYEEISRIFTTVAGNGRLMGDQLLQLSSRGLNAAATISDYVRKVASGSTDASDSVKELVASFDNAVNITEGDIRDLVSKGQISFKLFTESMTYAFADSAERANETFTGAFSNMKSALARIGQGFISPLIAQNSEVVELFNAIRLQINNVKSALVFDEELGNVHALSKQFTDTVLQIASATTKFVNTADLSDAMSLFYYGVETAKNAAKGLYSILKPLGQAAKETFFTFKTDDILRVASQIAEFTEKLKLSEESSRNLHDAFKGIFDIIKLFGDGLISLLSVIFPINVSVGEIGKTALSVAGDIGRLLSSFSEWVRSKNVISDASEFISGGIGFISDVIHNLLDYFEKIRNLKNPLNPFYEFVKNIQGSLGELDGVLERVDIRWGSFWDFLKTTASNVGELGSIISKVAGTIADGIFKIFGAFSSAVTAGGFNGFIDIFNTAGFMGIIYLIRDFIKTFSGSLKKPLKFIDNVNGILSEVKNTLVMYQNQLKADILKKIALSVAILAGSLVALSLVDSDKMAGAIAALSIVMWELVGAMTALNKVFGGMKFKDTLGMSEVINSMIPLASSILILSFALKKIGDIDSDKLSAAIAAITALIAEMSTASILISKYSGPINTGTKGLVALAASIYILTYSVEKLSKLNTDELVKGISSVGVLLGELAAFMAGAKYGKLKMSQALAIIILAESLRVLQDSVSYFGKLDVKMLTKGLGSVGVLLTEIAGFNFVSGKSRHVLKSAASMFIIAEAINKLISPMLVLGRMSLKNIGKGLSTIGGALAEITIALKMLPKNALIISAGLYIVSEALGNIVNALSAVSGTNWMDIGKGLVAIGGSMLILAVAMNSMKGTLGASAAILLMAAALNVFVPVLKTLGGMSWEDIAKGLIALAGAFAVVGIASFALAPIIPIILALSTAMAVLGLAIAAIGGGLVLIGAGLTTLAAAGIAGVAATVEIINLLVASILSAFIDNVPRFGELVKTLILTFCDVLVACIPTIVDTFYTVITTTLDQLSTFLPSIVHSLIEFIISIINGLTADLPKLVDAVINFFAQFFASIANSINTMDVSLLENAISGIEILAAIMAIAAGLSYVGPAAVKGMIFLGIVLGELAIIAAAFGALAQIPGLKWLVDEGGDFLASIGSSIGRFVGGFVGGIAEGVIKALPAIAKNLSDFMDNLKPFLDGAEKINPTVVGSVGELAKVIMLLTATDVLDALTSWLTGGNSLNSFGDELSEFGPKFAKFAEDIKEVNPAVVMATSYAASALAELASNLPNNGGLAGKIFGENNLSDFGDELVAFAPTIVAFADQVKNVNPKAVQGAADAAMIMSEMAANLPNSGGLASKIFGDNSLAEFGEELVSFAPAITKFADQVKDVNPKAVKGAASAASIMSEVAEKLPNSGGLASKIFGDNKISEFGEELVAFGPSITKFADQVKDVNPKAVKGAASAAEIMAMLAEKLPEKGGIFDVIFGGQTSMSEFGAQLKSFGEAMVGFSNEIKGINTFKITSAAKAIDALVDLAKKASGTDFSGMTQLGTSLYYMASNGVKEFYKAFNDGIEPISKALNAMVDGALKMLDARGIDYYNAGYAAVRYLASGIADASTGQFQGLRLKMLAVGYNVVAGVQSGIEMKLPDLAKTVAKMAKQIDKTLRIELDIHSPSKKTEKIGKYTVQGLAKGMIDNSKSLDKVIKSITSGAMTAFEKLYVKVYKIQSKQDKLLNSKIKFSSNKVKNDIVKKTDEIVAALEEKNKKLEWLQEKQSAAEEKAYNKMLEAQQKYEEAKAARAEKTKKQQVSAEEQAYNAMLEAQQEYDAAKSAYDEKTKKEEKEKTKTQLREEKKAAKEKYKAAKAAYAEQLKAQEEAAKEAAKIAKAEYENLTNINNLKLTAEDKYWKKLLETRKKGVDGAAYQSMTLQQFEMQIMRQAADVLKSYTSELDSVANDVNSSLSLFEQNLSYEAQRIQNAFQDIIGSYDLFSDVEEVKTVTKTDLTDYIDNQINSMADFYDTYVGLESRLIGTSLWDYVSQLGPENISEMNALMTMTDEELAEYIQKYEDKVYNANLIAEEKAKNAADKVTKENLMQIARDRVEQYTKLETSLGALTARTGNTALTEFLRTLGVEDQEMIDALSEMSDEELAEYARLYEEGLQKSTDVAKVKLKDVQEEAEEQLQEIFGVKQKIDLFDFSEAFDGTMESLNKYLKKIKSKKVKKKVHSMNEELRIQITDSVKEAFDGVDGQADKSGAEVATAAVKAVKRVMKKNEGVMEEEAETYIERMEDTKDEAEAAGREVATAAVEGMESVESRYYFAGYNASKGFIDGMLALLDEIRETAAELGAALADSVEDELDINSPSRVMARIGNFAALGFIGSLLDSVSKATLAGSAMSEGFRDGVEDSLGGLQQIIYDEMEHFDPVISPQVDLSEVFAAAKNVNDLFNAAVALNVQNAAVTARSMDSTNIHRINDAINSIADAQNRPNVVNHFNMEQNNYSPKALSAIEIYRNTNNQFSQLKGAMRNDQVGNRY